MHPNANKHKIIFFISIFMLSAISVGGALKVALALGSSNLALGEASNTVAFNGYSAKYTFRYPESWSIYSNLDNVFPYVRVDNREETRAEYFKIEVVTLPNKQNLTLLAWIKNLVTTSYPLPEVLEQKEIEVAGVSGIYQLEKVGSFVHPVIYLQKGREIYLINISSAKEEFQSDVEAFLESFTFNF